MNKNKQKKNSKKKEGICEKKEREEKGRSVYKYEKKEGREKWSEGGREERRGKETGEGRRKWAKVGGV